MTTSIHCQHTQQNMYPANSSWKRCRARCSVTRVTPGPQIHKSEQLATLGACYNCYLPKTCTLAIHERLIFPLNRFKPLVFFITPMRLHHKSQERVVRSVSWSEINDRKGSFYGSIDMFPFLLFLPKFHKTLIEQEKGWHTKHGVELQQTQVQAAVWTEQVVFFGPRKMIKVWFSAERVQNPYFAPEGGGDKESVCTKLWQHKIHLFLGSQCAV